MENATKPMSVGEWMITLLLLFIPFVNIIMLLVWAFGGGAPIEKSNFAKAHLLWLVIAIVLSVLMMLLFGTLFMTTFQEAVQNQYQIS